MVNPNRKTAKTRERLLKAAIDVFSTEGVVGATTRQIARVANVNEVTLFRHFQSKEQLLAAATQQITAMQVESLDHLEEWTQDLARDLLHYARLHNSMLEENEALIRMFIGEAKRHPDEALQVLQQAFLPLRETLTDYLRNGVERGTVRPDLDLSLAVDQLTGMLLAGMLRRHVMPVERGYHPDHYVESCVDLIVRGIGTATANLERLSTH